jgi:ABC-2 type transport system ATP-binding protein
MKGTHMIEIDGLTKRYGDKTAVDGLSFVVEPGVVTGFLGPNGAGKSTTMRMIAGLDRPSSGSVRVNGKHYPGAAAPMAEPVNGLDPDGSAGSGCCSNRWPPKDARSSSPPT